MQEIPRRLAFLTAVAGIFLLGYSIWYWITQKLHFSIGGDWIPILMGVCGSLLLVFGTTAFRFFGNLHAGLRRRQALRIIGGKTVCIIATAILLAIDIGGIGVAFAAAVLLFGMLRNGGSVLLPVAFGALAYIMHRAAEFILMRMRQKRMKIDITSTSQW